MCLGGGEGMGCFCCYFVLESCKSKLLLFMQNIILAIAQPSGPSFSGCACSTCYKCGKRECRWGSANHADGTGARTVCPASITLSRAPSPAALRAFYFFLWESKQTERKGGKRVTCPLAPLSWRGPPFLPHFAFLFTLPS